MNIIKYRGTLSFTSVINEKEEDELKTESVHPCEYYPDGDGWKIDYTDSTDKNDPAEVHITYAMNSENRSVITFYRGSSRSASVIPVVSNAETTAYMNSPYGLFSFGTYCYAAAFEMSEKGGSVKAVYNNGNNISIKITIQPAEESQLTADSCKTDCESPMLKALLENLR